MKRIRKDRVIERSEIERAFMERDILSFVQNPFVGMSSSTLTRMYPAQ